MCLCNVTALEARSVAVKARQRRVKVVDGTGGRMAVVALADECGNIEGRSVATARCAEAELLRHVDQRRPAAFSQRSNDLL